MQVGKLRLEGVKGYRLTAASREQDKELPEILNMVGQAFAAALCGKLSIDPGVYYLRKIWSEEDPYKVDGNPTGQWRWWLECALLKSTANEFSLDGEPAGMVSERGDIKKLIPLLWDGDVLVSVATDGQMTRLIGADVELIED